MYKKILLAFLAITLEGLSLSACISIGDATQPAPANLTPLPISTERRDPMAALTGTPVLSTASGPLNLTITNNSDWDICYAYLTPPTLDNWGKDQLNGYAQIPPSASQVIPFETGTFDMRAENCDYMALDERYGVALGADTTWQVNGPQELFFEDFSGSQPAWQAPPAGSGQASMPDETLHLASAQKNTLALVRFPQAAQDSTLVVEATSLQKPGGGTGAFGALCRVQTNGDGYLFLARSDNQYSIQKVKGQQWTALADWQASPDVMLDAGVNVIEIECNAGQLRLRINGLTVAKAADSEFTNGAFGLGVISFADDAATYQFDNLSVVLPDQFK